MQGRKGIGSSSGIVALALSMAGCGGGGSMVAAGPASGTQTAHMGPITASYSAAAAIAPIGGTSGITAFAGLTGANFTLINFQAPRNLDQTRIAYVSVGSDLGMRTCDRFGGNQTLLPASTGSANFPAFSSDGRLAFIQDDAIFHSRVHVANLDGTGLRALSPGPVSALRPSWSPDNTKIAYTALNNALSQIYVVPSAGGPSILISDGTSTDSQPSWSPDGNSIIFTRYNAALVNSAIYSMSSTGGNLTQLARVAGQNFNTAVWSPDGQRFAYVNQSNPINNHLDVIQVQNILTGETSISPAATYNYENPSWSPDGRYIAYEQTGPSGIGINVATFNFDQDSPIVGPSGANAGISPAWQPFPRVRFLVGSGALMGSNCSGFLFAQQSDLFTGFVSFSATTPSTATVTAVAGGPSSTDAVYSLGGDTITAIKYFNGIYGSPVTAVPTGGLATAKGALVSFDSSGQISFVLPYSHSKRSLSKAGAIVFEGSFLGAWDKKGRNTMPRGASEVTIDGHSGKVLSVR